MITPIALPEPISTLLREILPVSKDARLHTIQLIILTDESWQWWGVVENFAWSVFDTPRATWLQQYHAVQDWEFPKKAQTNNKEN